ncbi:MAG TPA: sulfatase-like hydrolase/transferase [Humisphaera sp.]|jgi:hypothetical protein|nr:sulfatase-like hydrolase/transferase [Humisphaera sp.]
MKRVPFYPLLTGLFVLLSLYASNLDESSLQDLLISSLLVIAFTWVLFLIGYAAIRNIHRTAMVVGAIVFCFMTYGYWVKVVMNLHPYFSHHYFVRTAVLFVQAVLIALLAYWAIRRAKDLEGATSSLNWIWCLIVGLSLANIGWNLARNPKPPPPPLDKSLVVAKLTPPAQPPDIYFILLDAHGRQDVLRDQYQYDGSAFFNHLREKGFFVADKSNSNYMWTILSMSSMLNMRYMDDLTGNESTKWHEATDRIRHNSVMAELKSAGYRTIAFETLVTWLCLDNADEYYKITNKIGITPYQQLAIDTTALSQLGGDSLKNRLILDQYHQKRQMLLYKLSHIGKVAAEPGPKFVFMHTLEPHPPFVFAADGSDPVARGYGGIGDRMPDPAMTVEQYHDWYREQITFIDNQITTAIDTILANSSSPPVIVLAGDHGPRSRIRENPDAEGLTECLSNLTAVYLPGKNNQGLYASITPVNLFRVVLNDYFNAGLPMLPDRCFFSWNKVYQLDEVTSTVRSSEPAGSATRPLAAGADAFKN